VCVQPRQGDRGDTDASLVREVTNPIKRREPRLAQLRRIPGNVPILGAGPAGYSPEPGIGGRRQPPFVLSGQEAGGERCGRDQADAVGPRAGAELVVPAVEHVVMSADTDEAGQMLGS
jgi:hypothetical protein